MLNLNRIPIVILNIVFTYHRHQRYKQQTMADRIDGHHIDPIHHPTYNRSSQHRQNQKRTRGGYKKKQLQTTNSYIQNHADNCHDNPLRGSAIFYRNINAYVRINALPQQQKKTLRNKLYRMRIGESPQTQVELREPTLTVVLDGRCIGRIGHQHGGHICATAAASTAAGCCCSGLRRRLREPTHQVLVHVQRTVFAAQRVEKAIGQNRSHRRQNRVRADGEVRLDGGGGGHGRRRCQR